MPVFTSAGPLINAMKATVVPAVDNMARSIKDQIGVSVERYYGEFDQRVYVRTDTLKQAPQKTDASGGGGSASAEVYMDTGLGYYTGTWNMENVISSAENGMHGGVPGSNATAVWSEPIGTCHVIEYSLWVNAFAAAGLNIS